MSNEYTSAHSTFLLLIMSKGSIKENEVQAYLEDCEIADSLSTFVQIINNKIEPLEQKIKIVTNELSGYREMIYLWLADSKISQFQNKFSKADIQYLKLVLEEIILSDDKFISEKDALNLSSLVIQKPFTMIQAQTLLKDWSDSHYLKIEENRYYLDSRCIHEFQKYFREKYPNIIKDCTVCKKFVYIPKTCEECEAAFHSYCFTDLCHISNVCPNCKSQLLVSISDNL